jgi:hypothetical protein
VPRAWITAQLMFASVDTLLKLCAASFFYKPRMLCGLLEIAFFTPGKNVNSQKLPFASTPLYRVAPDR